MLIFYCAAGTSLKTRFEVTCSGWMARPLVTYTSLPTPLTYTFTVEGQYGEDMLYSGVLLKTAPLILNALSYNGNTTIVTVKIADVYGGVALSNVNVTV